MSCTHEDFKATVGVSRLTETDGGPLRSLSIDIRVECSSCGKPVRFEGPIGISVGRGAHPCVSLDGLELRAAGHMGDNDTPLMGFRIRREQ